MSSKRDISPNYRSAKVGYPVSNQVRQQNEHDNLMQQLWDMKSKLNESLGEEPSVHSSTTPREYSRGENQASFSSNKMKNDEIQRMRNEKLERIRNENNRSRTPEKRPMTPTNVSTDKSNRYNQRDVSPRFHNEKSISDKYRTEPNTSTYKGDGSNSHSMYHPNNLSQASPRPNKGNTKEDSYIQLKFFNRAKEKERTEGLLQEAVAEDIRRLANTKKMSENSYKILIRKLENTLNALVADVDRDGLKSIGFEQLGRMFSQLGIFHIIQYDEESRLINEEQFYSGNPQDQKRRYQEMVVHEEVWNLLTPTEDTEHVSTDSVYAFFRIILDPANLGASEIARLLQDYIVKGEQQRDAEGVPLENHKLVELIKNLKNMTINRLHYDQTGRLKPSKAEELAQRNDEHTFKPKISDYSQALDKKTTQKFVQQNHLENRTRSKSPIQKQNPNKKMEELEEALFSLKGMQSQLQGREDAVQMNMRVRTEGDEAFLISEKESETSTVMRENKDSFLDGRLQVLYKKKEIADKHKEEQRKKQELEAMKDCTFQPAIKNYHTNIHRDPHDTVERLYTQHFAKKKRDEQASMEQIEKETLEMDQCTFKPEINNKTVLTPRSVPLGYDKNIMRMRKAIDEAQKKKELVEKKSTGENYEKTRNAKIKPPSFLENPRQERNPPFVYIEVGVGGGRTGRIGIHEDDDPRILAKNFAVTFQLNHEMEMNLVDIICQQLDDHFAKLGYENNYE